MKKIIIAGFLLAGFLSIQGKASAAFFDDSGGKWYMNPSWWEDYGYGTPPSGSTASFTDTPGNDRLDWVTSGWTSGEEVFRAKASKWAFSLNNDFEFTINYHYGHTGNYDTDEGSVEMGMYYFKNSTDDEPYRLSLSAGNSVNGGENKRVYWSSANIYTYPNELDNWWQRSRNDGRLSVKYDASEDELQFTSYDKESGKYVSVGSSRYEKVRDTIGADKLGVYFAGWSEGAGLRKDNAHLENFQKVSGTITPEPLSCLLFLAGAVPLVLFRLKRKEQAV